MPRGLGVLLLPPRLPRPPGGIPQPQGGLQRLLAGLLRPLLVGRLLVGRLLVDALRQRRMPLHQPQRLQGGLLALLAGQPRLPGGPVGRPFGGLPGQGKGLIIGESDYLLLLRRRRQCRPPLR